MAMNSLKVKTVTKEYHYFYFSVHEFNSSKNNKLTNKKTKERKKNICHED